jgi:hypothetical protein
LGDTVLDRAKIFFELLEQDGKVSSPELVAALGVKGARSVPANLTNPLKKRARKMRIPVPWTETATADGLRTVWEDRDGIAARMIKASKGEQKDRGLLSTPRRRGPPGESSTPPLVQPAGSVVGTDAPSISSRLK